MIMFLTGGIPYLGVAIINGWTAFIARVVGIVVGAIAPDATCPWEVGDTRVDTTIIETHKDSKGNTVEPTKVTKEEKIIKPGGKEIDEPPIVFYN